MQRVEAYRVEIPIVATDQYSSELSRANRSVEATNRTVSSAARSQDGLSRSSQSVARAQDGVSRSTRNASRGVDDVGRSADGADRSVRRVTRTVESFGSRIKALQRAKATVEVAVRDNASRVLDRIRGSWDGFRHNPITRLTVSAVDRAMGVLRGIKNTVLSIPTMITIGLSYVGIKSLNDATVGAAMNWEKYEVSMEHWLGGNVKQAKELTKWMGEFADVTPFSSPELFPALTTAVSMSNRDVDKAKKLLKVAADMASLTPGSTPEDSMAALFNASVGNTTRMKAFGMVEGVDDIKKMGGFDKYLEKVAKTFEGGAGKLSKTAAGVIATLKGYRGSFMRSIGTGFLGPMKPRLDSINKWLENNQEKWGRWKSVAMGHGKDLSEFIFSSLEKSFGFIQRKYLENPEFMKLDLKGKLSFVASDVKGYLNDTVKPQLLGWWEETGSGAAVNVGKNIGAGIVEGIKVGVKAGGQLFTTSWGNLIDSYNENGFNDETKKSALGAAATTAGAAYLGKKLIYNPAKSVVNTGKSAAGWLFGAREIANPSVSRNASGREAYRNGMPVDDRPNTRSERFARVPSRFSGVLKRLPMIGTAVAAMSLLKSEREELPSNIGAISGGFAGAKAGAIGGAALGSIVPGVGTAIGAGVGSLVGGIGGAIGGSKAGEWIGENWDSIKAGAKDASSWVAKEWNEGINSIKTGSKKASKWVKDGWNGTAKWFNESVWTPVSDAVINTTNLAVGTWSYAKDAVERIWIPFSATFKAKVWTPIAAGADTAGRLIKEKFESAKGYVSVVWGTSAQWFDDTVWTPISVAADVAGGIIGEKFKSSWNIASIAWGATESWFDEKVWNPLSTSADILNRYIGTRFESSYAIMTHAWGAADSWFESHVWNPLKVGADAAANVFEKRLAVIKAGANSLGDTASSRIDIIKKGISVGIDVLTRRGSEITGLKPDKEYARGGIARSPHIGLVGEAGVPEAMIPWDGSSRSKALWQQTGEALGMFDNASAASSSGNSGVAVSSRTSGNSGDLVLNVGDITIGQMNDWTAEGILEMVIPVLYELIVASLAKR